MRILLTGGDGFIGSALIRHRGHQLLSPRDAQGAGLGVVEVFD